MRGRWKSITPSITRLTSQRQQRDQRQTRTRKEIGRGFDQRSQRGAGRHSHRRAQQRRRARESFVLLENHGTECRRRTDRQTRRRHQVNFRELREFKEKFAAAGAGRFGSGWAWLIKNKSGKLEVISTPNQDSPLDGRQHADPRRRRLGARLLPQLSKPPARLHQGWWNVVNWDAVAKNY